MTKEGAQLANLLNDAEVASGPERRAIVEEAITVARASDDTFADEAAAIAVALLAQDDLQHLDEAKLLARRSSSPQISYYLAEAFAAHERWFDLIELSTDANLWDYYENHEHAWRLFRLKELSLTARLMVGGTESEVLTGDAVALLTELARDGVVELLPPPGDLLRALLLQARSPRYQSLAIRILRLAVSLVDLEDWFTSDEVRQVRELLAAPQ